MKDIYEFQWSTKYTACKKCGTTERKHVALGYCSPCYTEQHDDKSYQDRLANARQKYRENRDFLLNKKKEYKKSAAGKVVQARANQKMRELYPDKMKARYAVKDAIKAGKLIRLPCRDCGDLKVQGHHPDYTKPLDVIWLCSDCHMREHGRLLPPNKRGKGVIGPILFKDLKCTEI